MSKRVSDIDLMQYLDGELPAEEAREVAAALESDERAQRSLRSLKQLGECMRTYSELEADDAEPALAGLWERVDDGLRGRLREPEEEGEAVAAPRPVPGPRNEPGVWARFGAWLDSVRGYVVTGAVAAGAAAALVLLVSGGESGPGIAEAPVPSGAVSTQPTALMSQPPEVESLELHGASGSVLTIPSEGGGGGTAVIWLEREPETEGPI